MSLDILLRPPASRVSWLRVVLNNNAANIPDSVFDSGLFVQNIGDNISKYDRIWAEIK